MKHTIIIYTKIPCGFCQRAKQFFSSRNMTFQEINLTHQWDEISKLKEKTGHMTFPQIFIDDQFVGGYNELLDKVEKGILKL